MLLSLQLLQDIKSIFCHQVQFFYFFYCVPEVSDNKPRVDGRVDTSPQHFCQKDINASAQLLHDLSSVIKFNSFIFFTA